MIEFAVHEQLGGAFDLYVRGLDFVPAGYLVTEEPQGGYFVGAVGVPGSPPLRYRAVSLALQSLNHPAWKQNTAARFATRDEAIEWLKGECAKVLRAMAV